MRAIFGGTFDPPHFAHLAAGEAARDQLSLDTITFIPAGRPWQKVGRNVSEAHHRLRMTELAIEDVDYFAVDDREVHRDGWTVTIDTVESFEEERFVLIVGADAAGGIPTWHRSNDLLDRVKIAVVPRPGIQRSDVETSVRREIVWLDMPPIDLSGTMLRRHVAEGRSIRFLVPDSVLDYVTEHNLYQKPS
jgi:nicotinate-nucleotide adenylyltransferase